MAVIQQVFPLGGSASILPFTINFDDFGGTIPTNIGTWYNAQYGVTMAGLYFANFAYTDGVIGTSRPNGARSGAQFAHYIGTADVSITIAAATGARKVVFYWQNGGGWDRFDIQTSTGQSRTYTKTGAIVTTWQTEGVDLNALAGSDPPLATGFLTYLRIYSDGGAFGVIALEDVTFSAT
jgi:hypothetical protein